MKPIRIALAVLVLIAPLFAQQVNTDLVPASPGLNVGHSNQRWNGYFGSLDATNMNVATLTINGTVLQTSPVSATFARLDGTNFPFTSPVTVSCVACDGTLQLPDNAAFNTLVSGWMTL